MGLKTMRFVISRFPKVATTYSDHNTENAVDPNATGKWTTTQGLIDAPNEVIYWNGVSLYPK